MRIEKHIGVLRAERLDDPNYVKDRLNTKKSQFEVISKIHNGYIENAKIAKDKDYYRWGLKEFETTKNVLYVALDKNNLSNENIEKIKAFTLEYMKKGYKVKIAIDDDIRKKDNDSKINYIYTNDEMNLLMELNDFCYKVTGTELVFNEVNHIRTLNDYNYSWGMSRVLKASNAIKKKAQEIKDNNFTPFEAMLYIHKWATEMEYNENPIRPTASRMLPSILPDGKFIVCSGYASIVKAIVDELNMPGLKCDIVGADITHSVLSHTGHTHNMIHIQDEKYNINGSYVEDACWDCADSSEKAFEHGKGYSCCLYPVNDVLQFADDGYYNEALPSRYDAVLSDSKYEERYMAALPQGAIQETIFKLKEHQRTKGTPEIVEKYSKNSEPIPITTYIKGLSRIYSSKYTDPDEIERYVKKDIAISLEASGLFNAKASNCFSKQARNQKKKTTKVVRH